MGDWTYIEGTCVSRTVSMKKVILDVIGKNLETVFNYDHHRFSGRFATAGLEAAILINKLCTTAREFDPNCQIYIDANIYFQ